LDIFNRSPKSGNERLVSWWRKILKAGAIGRLGNVTKLLKDCKKTEFCQPGAFSPFSGEPTGREVWVGNFWNQPHCNHHRKTAAPSPSGKNATCLL